MVFSTRFLNWISSSWFSKVGLTSEIEHYSLVSELTLPACGSSVVGKLFMAYCLLHVSGCVHWQIWTSRLLSSSWAWHAGVSSTMHFWLLPLPLWTQNMYISSQTLIRAKYCFFTSSWLPRPKEITYHCCKKRKVKDMRIFQAHRIWSERIWPNSQGLRTYNNIINDYSHSNPSDKLSIYKHIHSILNLWKLWDSDIHASLLGQVGTKHVK